MRLVVKQGERTISEFRFDKGPVYIGRHANSQIFLPDKAISRQHAVIFTTQDGKWVVEDLDSANKTYVNGEAVHKAEIKTGDSIRITDFTIDVSFEEDIATDKTVRMEDTLDLQAALTTPPHEIVVRKTDPGHAPAMRLPARRIKDFSSASQATCKAADLDQLVLSLLDVMLEQFSGYHAWIALRSQANGPMTSHSGRKNDGSAVALSDIELGEKITDAVEKGQFLVMPRVSAQIEKEKIRSAMIAPIIGTAGCFGVLYIDNTMGDEHYSLSDLDYLMILAIHTAAIIENYLKPTGQ